MTDDPYRLPRAALPRHYEVHLEPDLAAAAFTGTVAVQLDVVDRVEALVCNAADLTVEEAWVEAPGGARVGTEVRLEPDLERLHLRCDTPLSPGRHTLHVRFRGVLNDLLRGWYRSTYRDDDGVEHVIAASQMQATDCRRVFPCWDEPDLKATFGITVVVDDGLAAISNGPEVARTPAGDGKVAVRFADTIPMSTYLVAVVVGPLEATEPVDVDGVPLRVVHVPGKGHLTGFALEVGAFALRWFQAYYGIPYPAEKCDLVALPDFAAGAMENLGCITFRESLLLVDPATATQQELMVIADVVSHELAHMWFGDLVTMRWWNGIWLNEAFATFMEVAACDAFRPEWRRWERFSLERSSAFEVDALTTTRPVEYEVRSPADADGMFDVLTYEKGGSLLRMLEQFLGTDRFRDGIRHYLRRHEHANTETGDLWDALESTTGEPVRRMMDGWIFQGGHPVVTAARHDGLLRLTQRRFLFSGADDGTRFVVPVAVRQTADVRRDERWVLLDGDEASVPLVAPDALVVVNAGAHGFYRVQYDGELRGRLTGAALAELSTPERFALVDDTWAAVVAGAMSAPEFCTFARSFADETDLAVWQSLLGGLRWCDRFLDGDARTNFQAFVRALAAPALLRLGWQPRPGEDPPTRELRGLLIRTVAILGADPETRDEARRVHEQALADPASVDADVAAAALAVVAATGTAADHAALVERFRAASTPQEMLRTLFALADFPGEAEMRATLELALSGEVRTQNAPFLLGRCIAHREHGRLAWRFVRDHWAEANERFPQNSIIRMVDPVKTLTTPEDQAEVAAFFADHPIPQSAKTLEQVLERQRVNVALRQREAPRLAAHFA